MSEAGAVDRGDRLEELVAGREVDRLLVTNLVNVRYLTGFGGTNGACLCGAEERIFLTDFRYTERAAAEVEGWEVVTVGGDWYAGIAERLAREHGVRGRQPDCARPGPARGRAARGRGAGPMRRRSRAVATGQGRRRAGGDRRRRPSRGRGLSLRDRAGPAGAHRDRCRRRRGRPNARAGGRAVLPADRRRRAQRRPAARRARRARDRGRGAGRLRHGRRARWLLLGLHPYLRHG